VVWSTAEACTLACLTDRWMEMEETTPASDHMPNSVLATNSPSGRMYSFGKTSWRSDNYGQSWTQINVTGDWLRHLLLVS